MIPGQKSCSRCGARGERFIRTYYNPRRGLCPTCCFEENKIFDADGWPPGKLTGDVIVPEGCALQKPGASIRDRSVAIS